MRLISTATFSADSMAAFASRKVALVRRDSTSSTVRAISDLQAYTTCDKVYGRSGCNFSFSGLKTAVRREVEKLGGDINQQDIYDLAASFQKAICDSILDRMGRAMDLYLEQYPAHHHMLVVAGGVAANMALKSNLKQLCDHKKFTMLVPPPNLCTDNGAMIAWAGVERLRLGLCDGLDLAARARWPLDPDAPPAAGAGVKA